MSNWKGLGISGGDYFHFGKFEIGMDSPGEYD